MNIDHQLKHFMAGSIRSIGYLIALWVALSFTPLRAATIVVLGDSLSAGYGIRIEEAWPQLLEQRLRENPALTKKSPRVINASISGETTAGGLSRLPSLLERYRPDVVIVELGANDGLRGLSLTAMHQNLDRTLRHIRKSGAKPLLIGMRLPPNYGRYAMDFERRFAELAKQSKTPFVPFLLAGVAEKPMMFQADGLHPTKEAQPLLLENIWPSVRGLLH